MRKYANISPFMRRPLVIYNYATAPFWISSFMRKIWFPFLSVHNAVHTNLRTLTKSVGWSIHSVDRLDLAGAGRSIHACLYRSRLVAAHCSLLRLEKKPIVNGVIYVKGSRKWETRGVGKGQTLGNLGNDLWAYLPSTTGSKLCCRASNSFSVT